MQILSRIEAIKVLEPFGFTIGDWNELKEVSEERPPYKTYRPPLTTVELYAFSWRLFDWLSSGWTILQIDNSTSPTEDEIEIFERVVLNGDSWNIAEQKTFIFCEANNARSAADKTTVVLLIFFSLMFEWHVHLISEEKATDRHISLQDGTVYFIGGNDAMSEASGFLRDFEQKPMQIAT